MSEPNAFETKTYSISQLLDAVRRGRVRLPLFQRGFIWTDEDRRLLFDSLQRGYPIGTLLLGQGKAPRMTLTLGDYRVEVPEASDALWVIDGQQRLSTLVMSLLGEHTGARRAIYFDLEQNRFVIGPRRRAAPPHWVKTHLLMNITALNRWLRETNLPDALSDRADLISGRLREYMVPAYLVPYQGEDDQVPREVFARVNRRGRALKSHEVFEALHTNAEGIKPLQQVDRTLSSLGFGSLNASVIERSAVAIAGGTPGRKLEDLVARDAVASLFERVTASLSAAIEFLAEEAGVPHVVLLPYDGALPTLARFFAQHPRPHVRNVELLGRWFWRGILTGDHRTDNGIDRRKWSAIDGDEHASVQRLLKLLPVVPADSLEGTLQPFRRGTARSNVELLALCALEPRVLVGDERGLEVPIASLLTRDDKCLPSPLDESRAPSERTLADHIMHPVLEPQELYANPPDSTLLATHAIPTLAWEAFLRRDVSACVEGRKATLERHLHAFLRDRTGHGATDRDRPPLDAYFEESA